MAEVPTPTGSRPPLDPDAETMRRLGYLVVDRVVEELAALSHRPVARRATAAELAQRIDEPLPDRGAGFEATLEFLFERVVPGMTRVSHPRFHAFVPVPGSFYAGLGQAIADLLTPFVGSWLGGATFAALELTTLRWIAEAVGYDPAAAGILTSGGSMANLGAIAAARARYGAETLRDGVLYVSEQGHASVTKAARTLGYRDTALRRVEADSAFRLSVDALAAAVEEDRRHGRRPFIVCANAGATNTGAVDPLEEIADFCSREGLWLHVDGAYGGFAALCSEGRGLLRGMERADSLTLDPHKWLYCPMGVGCLLVRDRAPLHAAFESEGDYLADVPKNEVNFYDRGPELSRPARVLGVWMLLRTVGLESLAAQIEADLALARYAESQLAATPGIEIVVPAQLSVVTFGHARRAGESEAQRARRDLALIEALLAEGEVMLSSTELHGRTALRFVVANHRTTRDEIDRSLAAIRRHSARLAGDPGAVEEALRHRPG